MFVYLSDNNPIFYPKNIVQNDLYKEKPKRFGKNDLCKEKQKIKIGKQKEINSFLLFSSFAWRKKEALEIVSA